MIESPDSSDGQSVAPVEQPGAKAGGSSPPRGSTYHFIIVRKEMTGGALLAQLAHAAGESASQYTAESGIELPDTTRAVILMGTKDELARLKFDLEEAEVSFRAVVENEGQLAGVVTALGLVTIDRDALKRDVPMLSQLRPWRA